jgi:hypothetical protein
MIRRWTAWRLAISAFVLFHVTATVIWVTPVSPLKQRLMPAFRYYMLPLGLWQAWCMFAPDPQRETIVLESEVIDVHGMRHVYEFPKVADLPWWRKMPRFRHPKFASNLLFDEFAHQREFTAKHAVRRLGLDASLFPLHSSLYLHVKDSPPPGTSCADPMTPARIHLLATYEFPSLDEVRP